MSFITQNDFAKIVNLPVSMPQAEIRAGETVVISTFSVGAGKALDLAVLCLHVVKISLTVRSSRLVSCSQSGNVVTASGDFFEPSDIGGTIRWDSGEEDSIANVVGPTEVYTVKDQDVASGYFEIVGGPPKLINTGLGTVYVGVYGEQFSRLNRPTGTPIFSVTLDSAGVVSLPLRSKRLFYGPDIVSVAITNNTTNIHGVEATVAGCVKSYA